MSTIAERPALTKVFIGATPAGRKLGIAARNMEAFAARTKIRVLRLPGVPPRFSAEDIERVLAESIKVG